MNLQLEALKCGLQALSVLQPANWVARDAKAKAWDMMTRAIADAEKQQALDAMADNERELGIGLQAAPPECKTEAEKTAYAFGWYKALESVRGQPVAQIDTSAERVEKEAGNKHVCPPNCGTGYCSCIECHFKKGGA